MIPEAFLARMRTYEGLDFAAFSAALEKPAVRALRLNTRKTDAATLARLVPFALTPLPFAKDAFYATEEKVGGLAAHHAGLFYMQDPSAIGTVAAAEPPCGARVLDLCAAPGGKSTQLAAAIGENGVLVSNEYVPARCRILQGNIERMGLTNTVVTNLSPAALADFYGAYFDFVLADAPCSGEGMFRKYETAGTEWSEANVTACACRQREILESAARCVAPGGSLLYATCTFSIEENEANIDAFLDTHSDFSLVPVSPAVARVTADGIVFDGAHHKDMVLTRRFYPHLSAGEGQFIALMTRTGGARTSTPKKDGLQPLSRAETNTVQALFADILKNEPPHGRLMRLREDCFLAPDIVVPPHGVFAAGVCLGIAKKGRIEPHHHFYSAYGQLFRRQVRLTANDPRTAAYLSGEEIPCPESAGLSNGYAAVLFENAPLGGGKLVNGMLKNHYPKGLRLRK